MTPKKLFLALLVLVLLASVATALEPHARGTVYREALQDATEPFLVRIPGYPIETCHSCRPQPPGTWQPILYPTPLRNFLFGSHRWQPGQWVPLQQESPQ